MKPRRSTHTPTQHYVLRMEDSAFEGLGELSKLPDCRERALAADRIETLHELAAYRLLRDCRDGCGCEHASIVLAHLYAAQRADRLERAEYCGGFDAADCAAVLFRRLSGMVDRLVRWAFTGGTKRNAA